MLESSVEIKAPKLDHPSNFYTWYRKLIDFLRHKRNPEDVPLFYVLRDDAHRPATFHELLEELAWKLPLDPNIATYRRDNNALYQLVLSMLAGNQQLTLSFKTGDTGGDQDCRQGFLAVRSYCEGPDVEEKRRIFWTKKLNKAAWTGYGVGRASTTLVPLLHQCYTELEVMQNTFSDLQKLQHFNANKNAQHEMRGSTCWKAVSDTLRKNISRLQNGINVDSEGRPITFDNFTTYLIEEEQDWLEQIGDRRTVSQVNSNSNANSNANANSNSSNTPPPTYNRETGEPLHRFIGAIDVGVIYRDVTKVDTDEFKQLPNVTKQYFRENPNKDMPKKFKNMTKPKPKSKPKKSNNRRKKSANSDGDDK